MSNQPTRRRRASRAAARKLAVAAALAALVATLGAGQALAGPDERVLERQARIDHQKAAAGQADEQSEAEKSVQGPATRFPRRFQKPEPPMDTGSRLDADEQTAPAPVPPASNNQDILVIGLTVAALVLAAGAVTTWRISHRRPGPEPTS
jgi:hypothetical protein